jgi:small GTP-binding protein
MRPPKKSPPDSFKVVLLGDASVGKTSLLTRWIDSRIIPNQPATIGVGFRCTPLELNGIIYNIHIWDTAGQEVYRSTSPIYCRNARAAMLVYDITCRASFDNLDQWLSIVRNGRDMPLVLVGNKTDLSTQRMVDRDLGYEWAQREGAKFYETSATTNDFVKEAFVGLAVSAVDGTAKPTEIDAIEGLTDENGIGKECC